MRLFRGRAKPKSDQEDKERMLDADSEGEPAAPTAVPNAGSEAGPDTAPSDTPGSDAKEAETAADAPKEAPRPQDNLLAQIGAETDAELAKEEAAAAEGSSPTENDELDPELLDIFRDARNEIQESSLAAELEDIGVQELLDEILGIGSRLGITAQSPARHRGHESDEASERPAETPAASEPSAETPDASEPPAETPEASAPIQH